MATPSSGWPSTPWAAVWTRRTCPKPRCSSSIRRTSPFASDDHAKHWLLRVTVNECRKLLRAPWRKRVLPLEDYDAPTSASEDHSDVLAAVMALKPKYRLCVYLYYYEDWSVREVAPCPGGQRVHRADLAGTGPGEAETDPVR